MTMTAAVLMVGAGPTGLLMTAELQRRGVQCLLIDAHDRPMEWDRATVVHPRSLEIFESLGILEPLLTAGVKQRRARLHANGAVLGVIDLHLCGSRYPFNIGVSEEVTEALLAGYLARQGGGVQRGTRLVALRQEAGGLRATIEHAGAASEVLAQWVVGCDGHHSAVRTLAGIEQEGHDIAEPWAVFDAGISDWPDAFESNYAYLDDIPVILTALPDRRWRVYLRPRTADSDLVADALATLRGYLPDARFHDVSHPTRFNCHAKVAKQFRAGRILLAGDAAHTCSPAQGHGMNTGLQDAYNLAWKLALVAHGHCGEALLDSYHAERRPVADMVLASGDAAENAQMVALGERAARDAAIRRAFEDAETRHHEAVAEAELNIDYAGSPIVMGEPADTLGPGQRLSDRIEILLPEGGTGLLHRYVTGQGHTVFLIGGLETGPQSLTRMRRQLRPLFDGFVIENMVVLAANSGVSDVDAYLEPDAARQVGVADMMLLAVRADGHIGLRATSRHAESLAAYVALLSGSA
ncbi:monooxygenase [Bordetella genomosp. 8]|uniref:Monooxygenase n=1 Tax=Bordetella genomosp. 8 TaxID=1416806 RepID=A0A1W6YKE1_9BORD|nr:FAD-dependent monooxygenase [Bordetella genomosp. 8]ARP81556.1 monooxygenase [Bordetella genomosp. 8]